MNQHWQTFLQQQGADFETDGGAQFPGAPLTSDCALCDLSSLGLIAVGGPEAIDFLQGQVSNDLRELSEQHTQLSSHCSPKGRMLANFRVLRIEESLFLVLPRSQVAALMKRLTMFRLRANVSLDDASDALVCSGFVGDCHEALLSEHFGTLPAQDNGMVRAGDASLVRISGPVPRWLLIAPASEASMLWQAAQEAGAAQAGEDLWALNDILAGLPTVYPETSDAFVPQMANMQLIDGVSFHKGCYTGQEVVARMQYLGKLKRRMYLGEVESKVAPRPGDELSAPESKSGQGPGRIVDARSIGPNRYKLLLVADIATAETGQLLLGEQGPQISLTPPPYGFAEAA